ncbi:MAG: NUDIX domain-containing protein [Desulfobacteraceae bacterium]|nr:MAG: NUDIX domain-containing protein [Desulfobacteraceae bacterium]
MDSEDVKKEIKTRVQKEGVAPPPDQPSPEVLLFFSFDLVNSTKYKTLNPTDWPRIFSRFFELIQDSMTKWLEGIHVWKFIGDEVVFYKSIHNVKQLYSCVPSASMALNDTVNRIQQEFPETRTLLSLRASVWIAEVIATQPGDALRDKKSEGATPRNIAFNLSGNRENEKDFLGPDIDVGFRISHYAPSRRLVISADLAYMLYSERQKIKREVKFDIEKTLKVVSYEELKGIWNDKRYPIIWYEKDWEHIENTFAYYEAYESPFIGKIIKGDSLTDIDKIEKIYEDLGKTNDVDRILDGLRAGKEPQKEEKIEITRGNLAEIHCVAVCFRENNRLLVARRPKGKRRYPGCWEFGCGQLRVSETFQECLNRSYSEDFGAKLEFGGDLQPVRTFVIRDEDQKREIPGIIFLAKVTNPDEVTARRHDEIDWINPDKVEIKESECVPDFRLTVSMAWKVYKEQKK